MPDHLPSSNLNVPPSDHDPFEMNVPPRPPADPALKPIFWNGGDAWVLLGVTIGGAIFANTLCQIGYLLLRDPFHWPPLAPGELGLNPYFVLLVQLVLYLVLGAFLFLLITRKYGLNFVRSLGLLKISGPETRRFAFVGLALALVVMGLSSVFPSARETPLEKIFGQGHAIYFFAVFGIVVAPFAEEMIFRGFLYPVFENLGGRSVAVLTTALIFSALHVPQLWGSWSAMGLILFVGLILSFVRATTGLLTPSWIIHIAYNSTLVLALVSVKTFGPLAHSLR